MTIGNVTTMSYNNHNATASKGNSDAQKFIIPQIYEHQSENLNVVNNNDVDPLNAMETMTGKISAPKSSYTITDEEAEYFREKYGNAYNENAAGELYYELADKSIISTNDASRASGINGIIPLSAFKSITYFGSGSGYGLEKYIGADMGFVSNRVFIKDICRTDENAYKYEWESFKEKYDRNINTWEDKLQESIDFERYLKEIAKNSTSGKHYPDQWHFDNVIENLEKTKEVIFQIFG